MAKTTNTAAPEPQEKETLKSTIKKNPVVSIIIGAVILAALIFIGINIYNKNKAAKNDEAATKMAKAQEYFMQGDFDQALNGDKSGNIGFVKVAAQYGSTDSGNLANLYAGLSYYYKGDYKNAVKFLEEFDPQKDAIVSNQAIAALGNSYAALGKTDKAISLLKEAAERADNPIVSPYCLVQAGILLESQNKQDEAVKLYQQVKSKYPQSGEAQIIDKYIQNASK